MKNTKKELKNSRGFSLIEIIIGLAVMGVISAGIATSMVQMSNSQKKIENKVEMGDVMSGLSDYMKTEDFCNKSLLNKTIPKKNKNLNIEISDFNGIAGGKKIKGGQKISDNLRIDAIYITPNTAVPAVDTLFKGSSAKERMLDVVIKTSRLDPNMNGSEWMNAPDQKFTLPVKEVGGVIKSCNHLNTAENACTAVGGKWTTPKTGASYCKPNAQCINKGSYITWTCRDIRVAGDAHLCGSTLKKSADKKLKIVETKLNGQKKSGGIKNPYNNQLKCSSGKVTGVETGVDTHLYSGLSCGKKCTYSIIQEAHFFSCIKCD